MDQLWAPWRLSYVTQPPKDRPSGNDCFICNGLAEANDRANLIARRTAHSVGIRNRFPYHIGHLLGAPTAHKAGLDELSDAEMLDLQHTLVQLIALLRNTMTPDGFNVGLNLGKVAGAGLPGHLHWHLVPRWAGDTNFMPVVSDTRVIVQSLDALYDLVIAGFEHGA